MSKVKAKRRVVTDGKLPERMCPSCGCQVLKIVKYGQLSYECTDLKDCRRWGPWDEAPKRTAESEDCCR